MPMKWVTYYYHPESDCTEILGVADTEDEGWEIVHGDNCKAPLDYFVKEFKYVSKDKRIERALKELNEVCKGSRGISDGIYLSIEILEGKR